MLTRSSSSRIGVYSILRKQELKVGGAVVLEMGMVLIDDDIVTRQNDFLKLVIEAVRRNTNITPDELVKEIDISSGGPGTRYVNHSDDEEESLDGIDDKMIEEVDVEELYLEKSNDEKIEDRDDPTLRSAALVSTRVRID
ncbi:hypothetical protein ACMFMG_006430 [Clarireedia jacksonii]